MRHKVLFRSGVRHIFCISGFENVSPGDGSGLVEETHCAVKVEWKLFFFLFFLVYDVFFYFAFYYILFFIIFYVSN